MKISDIITLAKAGYKRKDIEELLSAEEQPDPKSEEQPDPKSEEQPDPKSEEQPDPKSEEQPDPKSEEQPDPKSEGQPDYKKLYEESQKTIKKMQARNRKDPNKAAEPKSADDIALEHVNELFKGV